MNLPTLLFPSAIVLGLLGTIAGACDLVYRRIPNWLVLAGFLAGLLIQSWTAGMKGCSSSLFGAGWALAVYLPLFALRAVGGGDLKLMVAIGAITGPSVWQLIFVLSAVLGGLVAVGVTLARSRIMTTLSNVRVIVWEALHLRPPYRGRPELDVTRNKGVSIPRGTVIGVAIALYICAIWLR